MQESCAAMAKGETANAEAALAERMLEAAVQAAQGVAEAEQSAGVACIAEAVIDVLVDAKIEVMETISRAGEEVV